MKRHALNDDAQAAIIFTLIVGLIAVLALFIYLSPVMDQFSSWHKANTLGLGADFPLSQDREDAIFITQIAYQDYPIIAFLVLIIASVVAALKWRSSPA